MILVGAIAIAFIVLGLVVVFNGVLYTETISSSATSQSAADADLVEAELEQAVVGIVERENLEEGEFTESELRGTIEGDDGFAAGYRDAKANSRPELVNVSVGSIEPAAVGSADVSSLTVTDLERSVGLLRFDLEANEGGSLVINDTEQDTEIEIEGEEVGFAISDDEGNACTVESGGIDIVTGQTSDDTCEFETLDPAEPSNLSITADGMAGTTDLVLHGSSEIDDVGATPGVWSVDLEVTYRSDAVTYDRTQSIDVYGDRP